jgi:hypothetical protein
VSPGQYARERAARDAVALACAWEVAALVSGRVPSVTSLQARHQFLGAFLVAWLAVHFWQARAARVRLAAA